MNHLSLLHRLFETQASVSPDNIALMDGDQTLTYRQLNQSANQLARYWQAQGLGAGDIVAIGLPHCFALVTAILATLKIGAAWLALDLNWPAARLRTLLDDANARLLVTDAPDAAQTFAALPTPLFLLDPRWPQMGADMAAETGAETGAEIGTWPIDNLDNVIAPDAMAYLVYTSGSTGKPKGVVGPHAGMCNRLHWMWQRYPYAHNERCCAKTPLGFVDAVAEIFAPLCQGIPLYLFGVAATRQLDQFVSLLATHRITRLVLVPSLLDTLLSITPDLAQRLPDLDFWVVSGETVSKRLVQQFFSALPDATLINLYGSSEVAADATFYPITANDGSSAASAPLIPGPVPIGKPIANMHAFVLDEQMQPVPRGQVGEIYIGGIGLADGYLNQPELSQQVFLSNPFDPASKLYKTGDLGAWRSDGELLFHGRTDQQIKINGRRVELGEIEATLLTCPGIAGAAVKYWRTHENHGLLVAYMVFKPDAPPIPNREIQAWLATTLPWYMIPAQMIHLAQMPLNANGKIDRLALPAPSGEHSPANAAAQALAPNATELEAWLAKLLADLCAVVPERVMLLAELGIDSLVFARMRSAIINTHGVSLSFNDLFQAETLPQLAACIARQKESAQTAPHPWPMAQYQPEQIGQASPISPIHTATLVDLAKSLDLALQPFMDTVTGVSYHLLAPAHYAAATDLIGQIFSESEPLCVHLGIGTVEMNAMFTPLFQQAMRGGLALVAMQNNQVVGATIALDKASLAQLPEPEDHQIQQRFRPIFEMLDAAHPTPAIDVKTDAKTDATEIESGRVVSQFMTVVHVACMGLAVGYSLEKLTVALAIQQGYRRIESELTSTLSQTLARQLGYELAALQPYDRFVDSLGARPFQGLAGGVQLGILHLPDGV